MAAPEAAGGGPKLAPTGIIFDLKKRGRAGPASNPPAWQIRIPPRRVLLPDELSYPELRLP